MSLNEKNRKSSEAKLAKWHPNQSKTLITINEVVIGGNSVAVIAGPCSVESEAQIHQIASLVAKAGANILRGGVFKPRTSPYDFQGLGPEGLLYLHAAGKQFGLLTISEITTPKYLDLMAQHVDILQIGARNMQNFELLKEVGLSKKPVMLKRGLAATYSDLLSAAEYILLQGNANVILCERGIRTFETYTRSTLDLAAIPVLQSLSHLPIFVDPSHGVGLRRFVAPLACAGVVAGADGIMLEVHHEPEAALSDAQQTISTEEFSGLMKALNKITHCLGKTLGRS